MRRSEIAFGKRKKLDRLIQAVLLLAFYYDSYRYPFQISVESPNASYRAAPWWLQLGKYVLFVVILGFWSLQLLYRAPGPKVRRPGFLLAYGYLCVTPIFYGLAIRSIDLIISGIFFALPAILHISHGRRVTTKALNRVLACSVWIALVVEVAQVFAFVLWGRLPALGLFAVLARFGSFLDDPNAFGMVAILLLGFAVVYWPRRVCRRVALVGLWLCIILTQSFSAMAASAMAMLIYLLLLLFNRRLRVKPAALLLACVALLALLMFAVVFANQISQAASTWKDTYDSYMEWKSASAEGHLASLDALRSAGVIGMTGLAPWGTMVGVESAYIGMAVNFGAVYVVVYVSVLLLAAYDYAVVLLDKRRTDRERAFATGAFWFLIAVLFGLINLPFEKIFPVNALICLCVGLSSSDVLYGSGERYRADEAGNRSKGVSHAERISRELLEPAV